jgi:uncharacterized protein (TIGR02996 family)
MDEQGRALFRAVCEQPWDDTVRLVYADWLEEHGQPERAEFIRIQCELIRFQCEHPEWDVSDPRCQELWDRDSEFDPFKPGWTAELPRLPGVKWGSYGWSFTRGFIDEVTFQSVKAFREHGEAVFSASPVGTLWIRRVTARTIQAVCASGLLARVRYLGVRGRLGDAGVASVAGCPNLTRLRTLCIWDGVVGDAAAEALARSRYLTNLECLSISDHTISDRGALALAESPNLSHVTALVLHGTRGLSPEVVRRLNDRFERVD